MNKKLIRLTESDLHNIVKNTVRKILECDGEKYIGQFAKKHNIPFERAMEICSHNAEYYSQLYGYPYTPEIVARMELDGEL